MALEKGSFSFLIYFASTVFHYCGKGFRLSPRRILTSPGFAFADWCLNQFRLLRSFGSRLRRKMASFGQLGAFSYPSRYDACDAVAPTISRTHAHAVRSLYAAQSCPGLFSVSTRRSQLFPVALLAASSWQLPTPMSCTLLLVST